MGDPCPFCRAATGDVDTRLVAEWPDTIAIVPLDPVVDGHVIVMPRAHVEHALTDPIITAAVVGRVVELARRMGDACNLIASVGPESSATIGHLHWHLVPRRPGDGLTLPWTEQVTG